MDIWHVRGGNRLFGSCRVQGSKNASLPILAASVARPVRSRLKNVPRLKDVDAALQTLSHLGCRVERDEHELLIDSSPFTGAEIPRELMEEMRSSVIFMGALLASCGKAKLSLPGGCQLGKRLIDLHLSVLRQMDAEITEEGRDIFCRAEKLHGAEIELRFPSVGATENIMLAACAAEGETTIHGAAAGGRVILSGADSDHFSIVLHFLNEAGCDIINFNDIVEISSDGKLRAPGHIITAPYPGFPTDAQPILMAALLRAQGTTHITETIFENRFRQVGELRRLGGDIAVSGTETVLRGDTLTAPDLRGGAAMIVAGLHAEGETIIIDAGHIARGYERFDDTLCALGADVWTEHK